MYWSILHLNLYNFTTIMFDRVLLRSILQLNEIEMPLFATLCGNDIVDSVSIRGSSKDNKFQRTANYIISMRENASFKFPLTPKQCLMLANELNRNHLQNAYDDPKLLADKINNSINMYNTFNDSEINRNIDAVNLAVNVYEIDNDLPLSHCISYFDIRYIMN